MVAFSSILIATGSFWIPLILGLSILFFPVSDTPMLRYYRKSRYLMSFAYLLFAPIFLYFIITNPDLKFNAAIRLISPLVAVVQIIIFSYINTTLINPSFIRLRKVLRPLIPAFIIIAVYVYAFTYNPSGMLLYISYYTLLGFFAFMLLYYSIQFYGYYIRYRLKLENYYSDLSSDQLRWVLHSEIIIIASGIVAFFSGFLPNQFMGVFLSVMVLFFLYYGVRFIGYGNSFSVVEPILNHPTSIESNEKIPRNAATLKQLEDAIRQWEINKNFTGQKLTVENVAAELNTNRTYLSQYINTYKNKTFNEWINGLRIDEARQLLLSDPEIPIYEVCERVGFSDRSNFGRYFARLTGNTPAAWRKEYSNGNNNP